MTHMEAGADDDVSKPFSPRELALRIHAILPRKLEFDPRAPRFVQTVLGGGYRHGVDPDA